MKFQKKSSRDSEYDTIMLLLTLIQGVEQLQKKERKQRGTKWCG